MMPIDGWKKLMSMEQIQQELLFRTNPKEDVTDDVIIKCKTFKSALALAKNVSGLEDKQLAMELDIAPAQWSRIWSNGAHFPVEKLDQFITLCKNLIPNRYLALKYGFELAPLKTTLERELEEEKAEKEKLKNRLEYLEDLFVKKK
ncbi:MAG: hypothetical protein ACE5FU_07435 [Nitrospinota bacterium]